MGGFLNADGHFGRYGVTSFVVSLDFSELWRTPWGQAFWPFTLWSANHALANHGRKPLANHAMLSPFSRAA